MNFNYQKICSDLLKDLPERTKEVVLRRFGLERPTSGGYPERETLEMIGESCEITRERVRQIEADGLLKLKPKLKKHQKIFQYFIDQLKATGNLRKEDELLQLLGGSKFQNHTRFLLTLEEHFKRFSETEELYSLWTIDPKSLILAQKVIDSFYNKLKKVNHPLPLEAFKPEGPAFGRRGLESYPLSKVALISYLEISKKIQQNNKEGLFGLPDWPEINPRGVKDKAYIVFKKEKKPLHFTKVASLIEGALPQTVHNELIRDSRFVLVGRGIYALQEWGYYPGQVKDVIFKILQEERKPLTKEEILEKVLKQRLVKENTILLNLSNKNYFLRDSQGKYKINPEIA